MASVYGDKPPDEPLQPIQSSPKILSPQDQTVDQLKSTSLQQPQIEGLELQKAEVMVDWDATLHSGHLDQLLEAVRSGNIELLDKDDIKLIHKLIPELLESTDQNLHPLEEFAVSFYIKDGFKLINGTFDYEKSIHDFLSGRNISHDLSSVKRVGTILAKILSSALNKLPKPEKPLSIFRGSALSKTHIDQLQIGHFIQRKPFSSFSTNEGVAWSFSESTAIKSYNAGIVDVFNVIYVIETEKGRSIQSFNPDKQNDVQEEEVLVHPDVCFKISKIDLEIQKERYEVAPGSEEFIQAKEDGTLKGEKGDYYFEVDSYPIYKIHLIDA